VPDTCEGIPFRRGDVEPNGRVNITDATNILRFLFQGAGAPACLATADANDDGKVLVTDAIYLLEFLFVGGPPPPSPFEECGLDATPDDLSCAQTAASCSG
jgi:hypothetical protein